jgi:phosphogluconate dehydratase
VTPEALDGGAIGKIRDGDIVLVDGEAGALQVEVDAAELAARAVELPDLSANGFGLGRELFENFRQVAGRADQGAAVF